jgi:hypothetical protein
MVCNVLVDGYSHRAVAQAFYENVLDSSSNEESDGETDLLMAAAGMVNEHFLIPPRRDGLSKSGRPTSITIDKLATRLVQGLLRHDQSAL